MTYKIHLTPNDDNSYNMIVSVDVNKEEFALDFFGSRRRLSEQENGFSQLQQYGKGRKIKLVRFLVAGSLIASLSWDGFVDVLAASNRYNMSYLYTGTTSEQLGYIKNTKQSLNTVAPNFFTIDANGTLVIEKINKDFVTAIHAMGIKVVPFISNHWDQKAGISFLQNIPKNSTDIANVIKEYNLDGINIDIENVTKAESDKYVEFVSQLRQKLPADKEVSVAVAANPRGFTTGWQASYDYGKLAQCSDYLFIMSYDEHYQGGAAGPVASVGFVEDSIKYALKYADKDKIVLGIPFYGRIWEQSGNSLQGNGVDLSQVDTLISTYNGEITFDEKAQAPKATFTVKDGDKILSIYGVKMTPGKYVVWFENEDSFEAKLSLVNKYDIKGAGSWALGKEKSVIWDHYSIWLNGKDAQPTPSLVLPANTTNSPVYKKVNKVSITVPKVSFMRSGPSTKDKKVAVLNKGTILTVTMTGTNGWSKVKLRNGKVGYVASSNIKSLKSKTVKKPAKIYQKASLKGIISGPLKKGDKVMIISENKKNVKIWWKNKKVYVNSQCLS